MSNNNSITMYANKTGKTGCFNTMKKFATLNLRVNPNIQERADVMTDEELYEQLRKGYAAMEDGRVQDANCAFEKFLGDHEV